MRRWYTVIARSTVVAFTVHALLISTFAYYIPVIPPQTPPRPSSTVVQLPSAFNNNNNNNNNNENNNNENSEICCCCDDPQPQDCCKERSAIEGGGDDLVYPLDNPTLQYQLEEEIKNYPFRSETNGYGSRVEKDFSPAMVAATLAAKLPDQALIIPLPAITAFLMRKKDDSSRRPTPDDTVADNRDCGNMMMSTVEKSGNGGQAYGTLMPASRDCMNGGADEYKNENYGNCCRPAYGSCNNVREFCSRADETSTVLPAANCTVCAFGKLNETTTNADNKQQQQQQQQQMPNNNNNNCYCNSWNMVDANSNTIGGRRCCCADCCPNVVQLDEQQQQQNDDDDCSGFYAANNNNNNNENCCCCCPRCDRCVDCCCCDDSPSSLPPAPTTVCDNCNNNCCCCDDCCCCCNYSKNANANYRSRNVVVPNLNQTLNATNAGCYGSNCRVNQQNNGKNTVKAEENSVNTVQFTSPTNSTNNVKKDANPGNATQATVAESIGKTSDYGSGEGANLKSPFTADSGGFGRLGARAHAEPIPETDGSSSSNSPTIENLVALSLKNNNTANNNNSSPRTMVGGGQSSTVADSIVADAVKTTIPTTVVPFTDSTTILNDNNNNNNNKNNNQITTKSPFVPIVVDNVLARDPGTTVALNAVNTTTVMANSAAQQLLPQTTTTTPSKMTTNTLLLSLELSTVMPIQVTPNSPTSTKTTVDPAANRLTTTVDFVRKFEPIATPTAATPTPTTTTAATRLVLVETTVATATTPPPTISPPITVDSTKSTVTTEKSATTVIAQGPPTTVNANDQLRSSLPAANTVDFPANTAGVPALNSTFSDDIISGNETEIISRNQPIAMDAASVSADLISKPVTPTDINNQNDLNKEMMTPWGQVSADRLIKTEKRQLKSMEFNAENIHSNIADYDYHFANDPNDIIRNLSTDISGQRAHSHARLQYHSHRHGHAMSSDNLAATGEEQPIHSGTVAVASVTKPETVSTTNDTVLTSTAVGPAVRNVLKSQLSVEQQLKNNEATAIIAAATTATAMNVVVNTVKSENGDSIAAGSLAFINNTVNELATVDLSASHITVSNVAADLSPPPGTVDDGQATNASSHTLSATTRRARQPPIRGDDANASRLEAAGSAARDFDASALSTATKREGWAYFSTIFALISATIVYAL